MDNDSFLKALQEEARNFTKAVADQNGDWIVKGFIDVYKRIYTISVDTKVVSKIIELLLIPKLSELAVRLGYAFVLAKEQNSYPDISFISKTGEENYAVDIKSTYRTENGNVNGMTLGTFTGYFRNRDSTKNTTFPYKSYKSHIVLGVIYSKSDDVIDEKKVFKLEDLEKISSVVKDFTFFAQPKYRIASARPGSGNTKNIGSITRIEDLLNGKGPFAVLGEKTFDDYWMYYLTEDMARQINVPRPYSNLPTYVEYKNRIPQIRQEDVEQLELMDTGPIKENVDENGNTAD